MSEFLLFPIKRCAHCEKYLYNTNRYFPKTSSSLCYGCYKNKPSLNIRKPFHCLHCGKHLYKTMGDFAKDFLGFCQECHDQGFPKPVYACETCCKPLITDGYTIIWNKYYCSINCAP